MKNVFVTFFFCIHAKEKGSNLLNVRLVNSFTKHLTSIWIGHQFSSFDKNSSQRFGFFVLVPLIISLSSLPLLPLSMNFTESACYMSVLKIMLQVFEKTIPNSFKQISLKLRDISLRA